MSNMNMCTPYSSDYMADRNNLYIKTKCALYVAEIK